MCLSTLCSVESNIRDVDSSIVGLLGQPNIQLQSPRSEDPEPQLSKH